MSSKKKIINKDENGIAKDTKNKKFDSILREEFNLDPEMITKEERHILKEFYDEL